MKQSRCRSCSAPIFFAKTRTGKNVPIDTEPRADGNLRIRRVDDLAWILSGDDDSIAGFQRHVSHFATCPQAKKWRKPKQDRKGASQ